MKHARCVAQTILNSIFVHDFMLVIFYFIILIIQYNKGENNMSMYHFNYEVTLQCTKYFILNLLTKLWTFDKEG